MPTKPRLKLPKAASVFAGLHLGSHVEYAEIAGTCASYGARERHAAGRNAGVQMQMDDFPLNALPLVSREPSHQACPS